MHVGIPRWDNRCFWNGGSGEFGGKIPEGERRYTLYEATCITLAARMYVKQSTDIYGLYMPHCDGDVVGGWSLCYAKRNRLGVMIVCFLVTATTNVINAI